VIQLLEVCRRQAMPRLVGWMLLGGLVLGFGTDWVLVAAGA
jgi:ZIP family zinc transporter